jgi:SAM-dependent methyltransferase
MAPDDRWLAAVWPFVRGQLPPAPATVLEIGCGTAGGFVPALLEGGYDATGVDPEAPEGRHYHRVEFERYEPPQPVACVVASLSLHHVADLDEVLDRVQACLLPDGALVVVEWAWERFDGATAGWCFDAWHRPPLALSRAGCASIRSGGRPPDSPGMTTVGPGRSRRDCIAAARSCGGWMRGSPASSIDRGRTSSPSWPTPLRRRSRPRSTLA